MSGKMNLPYGTELNMEDNLISTLTGKPICYATSRNAHEHFASNDDGRGLQRGKLTYAIAYSERKKLRYTPDGHRYYRRFSEDEQEMLRREWGHFLKQDLDAILFNHTFFTADVEELQKLADVLEIKIKK